MHSVGTKESSTREKTTMLSPAPSCNGAGTVIAIWKYIYAKRVTQQVGRHVAPNLLETRIVRHDISTPESRMPPTPEPVSSHTVSVQSQPSGQHNPCWTQPSSSSRQAHGDMFVQHEAAYHIQTQLPGGRKSLLEGPGSVGNLCGDQWAKGLAVGAARNHKKPS